MRDITGECRPHCRGMVSSKQPPVDTSFKVCLSGWGKEGLRSHVRTLPGSLMDGALFPSFLSTVLHYPSS